MSEINTEFVHTRDLSPERIALIEDAIDDGKLPAVCVYDPDQDSPHCPDCGGPTQLLMDIGGGRQIRECIWVMRINRALDWYMPIMQTFKLVAVT